MRTRQRVGGAATAVSVLFITGLLFNALYGRLSALASEASPATDAQVAVVATTTTEEAPTPATTTTPQETKPTGEPKPLPAPKPTQTPTPTPVPEPVPAPVERNRYRNGTYTTDISYRTPESIEPMKVTVSVKDDIIVDSSIVVEARAHESRRYQNDFAAAYKEYVVGKSLTTLSLSRVSGASLTTTAFNRAIEAIRNEAGA